MFGGWAPSGALVTGCGVFAEFEAFAALFALPDVGFEEL